VVQVVECLLSKTEVLSSSPNTEKKKKKAIELANACNPSYSEIRKITVQRQPEQTVHETLSQIKTMTKKG
jgi:shikimate kinase